jgi:hypothetical protein
MIRAAMSSFLASFQAAARSCSRNRLVRRFERLDLVGLGVVHLDLFVHWVVNSVLSCQNTPPKLLNTRHSNRVGTLCRHLLRLVGSFMGKSKKAFVFYYKNKGLH